MHRSANETENRRGLVLGLTLAELLLLLLFMLLLALSIQLAAAQKDVRAGEELALSLSARLKTFELSLAPLIAELSAKGGLTDQNSRNLVDRLNKTETVERELSDLKKTYTELVSKYSALQTTTGDPAKLAKYDRAISAASIINPDDPPEALTRAVDLLNALGPDTKSEDIRRLSELKSGFEALKGHTATIEAEREKFRLQVINLSRSGNGLTLPSCWTTPDGQTQYVFDIKIRDDGLRIRDATPERSNDPQMKFVGPFDRGTVINEHVFDRATAKLFEWSKSERCRFYSIIRDATGPNSKQRYKDMRTLIEGHFYPSHRKLEVSEASPRAKPASRLPTVAPDTMPSPAPDPDASN